MRLTDVCCGFQWKVGVRIYAVCDLLLFGVGFIFYATALGQFDAPEKFSSYLSGKMKNSTFISPDAKAEKEAPEFYNESRRLMMARIEVACSVNVEILSINIYRRLALSIIFFALGSIGYGILAIAVFIVSYMDKNKRRPCIIIMMSELFFVCLSFVGMAIFQTHPLCAINYNLGQFDRQRFVMVGTIVSFLYKAHEQYVIYRFMILESFIDDDGVVNEVEDDVLISTLVSKQLRMNPKAVKRHRKSIAELIFDTVSPTSTPTRQTASIEASLADSDSFIGGVINTKNKKNNDSNHNNNTPPRKIHGPVSRRKTYGPTSQRRSHGSNSKRKSHGSNSKRRSHSPPTKTKRVSAGSGGQDGKNSVTDTIDMVLSEDSLNPNLVTFPNAEVKRLIINLDEDVVPQEERKRLSGGKTKKNSNDKAKENHHPQVHIFRRSK